MSAALTTNVDQKLLRSTKFPPEFEQRVDMSKVQLTVIKKWVADEVERILKTEDEIVTEMIFEILDSKVSPDVKSLQISLGGFMDQDAAPFCLRLWQMCLSAQENAQGIPQQLLEAKKAELREEAQAREARQARRREEEELEAQRERERRERARDSVRGGRGGRDYDRRPPPRDYSRSPPPRRRERDDDSYHRAPRTIDSYIPAGSRRNDRSSPPPPRKTRNRSPSSSGRSRSRSPPRRRRRSPSPDRASRSRSHTPPSRRYRARSRSPHRRRHDRRGGLHTRSQHYRPGSRSPRRDDSHSRTRSPPRKRRRSPSRSKTPPKKRGSLADNDLLASTTTADKHRLSRDSSFERKGEFGVEDEV